MSILPKNFCNMHIAIESILPLTYVCYNINTPAMLEVDPVCKGFILSHFGQACFVGLGGKGLKAVSLPQYGKSLMVVVCSVVLKK